MPTAVASDNSSIGYIIPTSRLDEFLHGDTPRYLTISHRSDLGFVRYLRQNQVPIKNQSWYRLPSSLSLKNPRPLGLTLKSRVMSHDQSMVNIEFSDAYGMLHATFACTDDRGTLPTWQIRRDGIEREKFDYPDWDIRTLDSTQYFIVSMDHGSDDVIRTMYYKKYPACFVEITAKNDAQNIKNLDRVLTFFQKALQSKITSSKKDIP